MTDCYDYCDYLVDYYTEIEENLKKMKLKVEKKLGIKLPIDLKMDNTGGFFQILQANEQEIDISEYFKKFNKMTQDLPNNLEIFQKFCQNRDMIIERALNNISQKTIDELETEIINPLKKSFKNGLEKAKYDFNKCQSECERMAYLMLIKEINVNEIETQFVVSKMTVDFAFPDKKVIIEVDGEKYHQNGSKDCYRDIKLREFGWKVLRYPCSVITRAYNENPQYFLKDINNLIPIMLK